MPSSQILATWMVGTDPACDLVLDEPTVSGHHCRLTRFEDGYTLEDLGSTNGTFVDDVRLPPRRPMRVHKAQRVMLGSVARLPWPDEAVEAHAKQPGVIRIGRSPASDIVLDYPVISWNHARIITEDGRFVLEDLGSSNGTAINEVDNRISRAVLGPNDDVYLGSFKIPAARLLGRERVVVGEAAFEKVAFARDTLTIGRDPQADHPVDHPMVSWHHARIQRTPQGVEVEDLGSLNGTFVDGVRLTRKVRLLPGQEVGVGGARFQLLESGALQRRNYEGNVSIQAVGVTVNAPGGARLLDPVSLTVYPSELVALMGPAGAGKTTFLKALNGYTPPAQGKVLFNGADLYRSYDLFRQQMGYVPQDDIVHSELTVREALYFSARLRTDLTDGEIDARIDAILDGLGILDKKLSLIGSPERKVLSGGQRKRVNIALELISDTPVLFLDEPTSGLSSYDAAGVIEMLKQLSRAGKTIVATIHQPSIDVFRKFDNLIMISRDSGGCGSLVFFGPAYPDSIRFFHDSKPPAGATRPSAVSDTDLSPEMLLTGLASARTADWADRFSKSRVPPAVRRRSRRKRGRARRRGGEGQPPLRPQAVAHPRAPQHDPQGPRSRAARHPAAPGPSLRHAHRPRVWSRGESAIAAGGGAASARGAPAVRGAWRQPDRHPLPDGRRRHLVRVQQRGARRGWRVDHLPARADGQPEAPVVRVLEVRRDGRACACCSASRCSRSFTSRPGCRGASCGALPR